MHDDLCNGYIEPVEMETVFPKKGTAAVKHEKKERKGRKEEREGEREEESKGNGNIATMNGLLDICLSLSSGYGDGDKKDSEPFSSRQQGA